ncbi:hypothetical protein ACN47E_004936 [Coniothyrium glycines]
MTKKVALITGGASGIGLKVAEALSARTHEAWDIHIVDLNADAGKAAITSLKDAYFHETNVTDYQALAAAFEATYNTARRLDFVYANAGIVERDNFYATHDLSVSPPPPNQLSIDINYKAVVNTSHLALHYFRKSTAQNGAHDKVLIMTASCGGLYPSEFCPMYSGAKAAVVQFNRAITVAYHHEGIRTFATCPGTINTGLLSQEEWKSFPREYFTPVEMVVDVVERLIDGGEMEDAKGKKVGEEANWGLTVEVNGDSFYFREQPEWCNDNMRKMMESTSMTKQLSRIERTAREKGVNRT